MLQGWPSLLIWCCPLVFGFDTPFDCTYRATRPHLDSLLFGCALAVHSNPALDRQDISIKPRRRFGPLIAIAMIVLSLALRKPEFRETLRYTLQELALYLIFIIDICPPTSVGFQWWERWANPHICWATQFSWGWRTISPSFLPVSARTKLHKRYIAEWHAKLRKTICIWSRWFPRIILFPKIQQN